MDGLICLEPHVTASYSPRMQTTSELLVSLGFPAKPFGVLSRFSIADLVKPGKRCGIYVLHFTDGYFYVGQSKDVTKRFVQHRRSDSHDDVDSIYFKQVPEPGLDEEEADITEQLEAANVRLRNILLVSWNGGEADFDEIMPPDEQERWLADLSLSGDADFKRLVDDELRSKYRRRFERFQAHPQHEQVVEILREYVKFGMPAARRGEVSFWSMSCWPHNRIFARLNLFWQEVLTISPLEDSLIISLHMAESPFAQLSDAEHDGFLSRFPLIQTTDHRYRPGGQDQVNFYVGQADALRFIREPSVLRAIRLFNLRLMRKGPSNWNRNHCMDMGDLIDGQKQ